MKDFLIKLNFGNLYNKSLQDWPEVIDVSNIECGSYGYSLPDFVQNIIERNIQKNAHNPDAILMANLHELLGFFIHEVAKYCTSVALSNFREGYIRSKFNEDIKRHLVDEWLGFEGKGWHEKDYKLAIQYLKNEGVIDSVDESEMYLKSGETVLLGGWVRNESGKLQKDEVFKRITWLLLNQLQQIRCLNSDFTLYKDPRDGRYWEKTFPEKDPSQDFTPQLKLITKNQAIEKYGPEGIE